jgi:hypothetical protein
VDQPQVLITQHELAEIAEMEREVRHAARRLDEMKSSVKEALMLRVRVQPGRFDAKLRKIVGRNVPWKTLVLERLGQAVADCFKKLYPPHVRFEVVVMEHAVEPLWKGKDDQAIEIN